MTSPRQLAHGGVRLALHELAPGGGALPSLLLLHGLGESARRWGDEAAAWPGRVLALDLAGHGDSAWRPGGAYTPELFAADVDAALTAVGRCCLAGRGLGAYVALLVAGARPELVPAALLLPGAGLAGCGASPDAATPPDPLDVLRALDETRTRPGLGPDPATAACDADVRPPDYARAYGAAARRLLLLEDGRARPPWWAALRDLPCVRALHADPARAVRELASELTTSETPSVA